MEKVKIYQMEDGQYVVMSSNGSMSFELAEFASQDEAKLFKDYYTSPKTNFSIYLPVALLAMIDKERASSGDSRADIIRRLLEAHYGIKTIY